MPGQRARFHFDNTYGRTRRVGPYILWQVGDLYCEPGYTIRPHEQAVYELTYAVSGRGVNLTGGTPYPMEPGTLFFNPRGDLHAIDADPGEALRYFYLGFDFPGGETGDTAELRRFFETLAPSRIPHAEPVGDAFIRLFGEVLAGDAAGRLLCESLLQELLCLSWRLLGESGLRPYRASDARAVDARLVCDMIHYLDANAAQIGALSELEREFGYSYAHLAQKFSEITGESPRAYHTRCRFRRAQEYLRRGESVTKTAELCGYQSIHAFSRAFHRVTGVTPGEYRRKYNG